MNRNERNALVVENLPLVGYLVSDLCSRATHLSRDDLASAGRPRPRAGGRRLRRRHRRPVRRLRPHPHRRRASPTRCAPSDWATRGARKRIKETLAVQESLTAVARPRAERRRDRQRARRRPRDGGRRPRRRRPHRLRPRRDDRADCSSPRSARPRSRCSPTSRPRYVRAAVDALPERMRSIVRGRSTSTTARSPRSPRSSASPTPPSRSSARRPSASCATGWRRTTPTTGDPVVIEAKTSQARRSAYLARLAQHAVAGVSRLSPTSPSSARRVLTIRIANGTGSDSR